MSNFPKSPDDNVNPFTRGRVVASLAAAALAFGAAGIAIGTSGGGESHPGNTPAETATPSSPSLAEQTMNNPVGPDSAIPVPSNLAPHLHGK